MKQIKHILLLATMLLGSLAVSAHDFEVNGIYYNITSKTDLTVAVTYRGDSYNQYSDEYSGAVIIPSTVTYNSKTYSVASIGNYAFYGCSSLTAINIPESSQLTSIGSSAFYECISLTSITISESSQLTSIGNYAFYGCSSLTSITIPEGVTSIGACAFCDCSSLTSITIPESVTSIGTWAFDGCSSLTAINIPESVTSIRKSVFSGCSSLTAINIPESVTSIGDYAFHGCSSLTTITIPESSQLTSIGNYAFYYCSSLTSITIPEDVMSIENYAFDGCTSLTSITIPESSQLTSIGIFAFRSCSSLTSITIPESVTSIGNYAFDGCSSLTAITIPESSQLTSIGSGVFDGCSSLTAINIPESVTSIGDYAFYGCSSLTSITIPEGVTSIGDDAFSGCRSLTSITIPESVTSIGDDAFWYCRSLTDVYCYAEEVPTTKTNAFNYSNIGTATLHVLASALEAYKTTAPWSSFRKFEILPPTSATITINQYGSATYCSEYALDFSEVEGLKAYVAAGYDSETGVVTLLRVMSAKPDVGLFIKGNPGNYVVPVIENTSYNALNMLEGTLEQVKVNKLSDDGRYVNFKYTLYNDELKFWSFDGGFSLGAGKAYLQIPVEWIPAMEARSIGIRFDEGGTTDIKDTEFTIQHSELIYDLMGRRVASPQKGNLYIINGKKVIY